jgi:lysophospholipase L1-like esterase
MSSLVSLGLVLGWAMAGGPLDSALANYGREAEQATVAAKRPLPGTALALAFGKVPAVAWLSTSHGGIARVYAAAPVEAPGTALGPTRSGRDGLPSATATSKGEIWVVAARSGRAGSRIWAQSWAGGEWRAAIAGPTARKRDHHPAVAAGSKGLWVVWVAEDDSPGDAALFASRWIGSEWTPAERLPAAVGTPMAPSVAMGNKGRPVVAWAASDGADAEIWIVERGSSGWSSPRQLTNNDVPDITPSVAAHDGTLVVAWTSFTPSGYVPNAQVRDAAGEWQPAHRLSPRPGAHPIALFAAGDAVVLWRATVGHREVLRSSVRNRRVWGPVSNLATAAGARPGGAAGTAGRLAVAWRRPDGSLAAAEGEILHEDRGLRPPVVRLSRSLSGPVLPKPEAASVLVPQVDAGAVPHTFSAFGDSITLGIVVTSRDPLVIVQTPGYVGPLESMLEDVFGAMNFSNDGVGGETTSEGLNRITSVIRARRPDSLLLMEGTNDVTFLVDPATIAFNLRQMINRANAEQPGIVTFLGTLIPRNEGWNNEFNLRTDTVNELLVSVATDTGATLVDTHTALDGNAALFSDHVHPNEDGYDVLAGSWYEGVEPVLMNLTNLGDIDGSGRVDGADLVLLGISFGSVLGDDAYSIDADINQDGIVDGFDLAILADRFGQTLASSSP